MMSALAQWLFGWLPADARARALRRLLVVWTVALAIALILWGSGSRGHPLDVSLVYSYTISTSIWFLSDPMRIALRRWFGTQGPHYWTPSWPMFTYLLFSSSTGYALGTAIGDAYSGASTWDMVTRSPARLIGFWVSGLVISGFFVMGFYQRAKSDELQRQATEARLKLLETQLEPHMLFNTLANLRALIEIDPPRAVDMLDRLNGYLRATLAASRSDSRTHTLQAEFDRLRDYLELMAVRMGARLRYALDLPDDLATQPLPPLLLQPLVENAIRHGLEPRVDGGEVWVSARRGADHWLQIEVVDTGVGMSGEPQTPARADGGFGLSQVRERVASLRGGPGTVELISRPGEGTTVRLRLPLNESEST